MSANTTKLLANPGSTPPGSLIPADEGSMVSMSHLSALVDHAAPPVRRSSNCVVDSGYAVD
jgi:hypothetical protein